MKGKVWRQKEKRWLVWEKLGGWKGGSEKEIGERKLSQWQKNVKEFCKEEVAESVEDGEEEKSGRARSPWRWETENVTLGEGEDSCVFLMAQGSVWVLSVLNAYHEFFSCEFLNNAFLLRQPLERKVAFPWVSIREWQLGCFFGRKKKNYMTNSVGLLNLNYSLWRSQTQLSWQRWAFSPVPGSPSGLLQRNAEQDWRSYKYPIFSYICCD